jgi:hypothetical protein
MIPTVNTSITSAQRMLEHIQIEATWAKDIQEGGKFSTLIPHFEKQNILRVQLIAQSWRKIGRQVLAMHPEIVEETRVATSDKISGEYLQVLPYINPLVVYPDPPVFASWRKDEHSLRMLGFFTSGAGATQITDDAGNSLGVERRIYATSDTTATHLAVVPVFEVLDEYGKVIDMEVDTFSIEYAATGTLADIVDDVMRRFQWFDQDSSQEVQQRNKGRRRWMRDVLSVVTGSLFYCCSTTLEAERVPAKQVAKRMPKRVVRTPLSFYKVGWTIGGALTRYRQNRERTTPSEQGDLGHQQDPQHRKAHFRMQWYGPRDSWRCERLRGLCNCEGQHRELIYVSAYWTHLERLGEEGMNTVRKVPRPNGKGTARTSVQTVLDMGQLPAEVHH